MNGLLLASWYAYLLALTLFIGKIVTFSLLFAPIVHTLLEKEQASKLLRAFFPRYYLLGSGCAIVGVLGSLVIGWSTPMPRVTEWTILWAYLLVAEVFALKILVPSLESAREGRDWGDAEATRKWEASHKLSVRLNLLNLGVGLILLGLDLRYLDQVLVR